MTMRTKLAGLRALMKFDNRWPLILNRGIFGEPLNVYRIRGLEFIEDHRLGDANGARELLTSGMYEPFLQLMKPENTTPWSIADLGASNGGFPMLLHVHGFRLRHIVAVEMNPAVFPRLRFNLEHNRALLVVGDGNVGQIECHNVAIGGRRRQAEIATHYGTGGSIYSGTTQRGREGQMQEVQVCLPEDVLKGRAFDLVKMDIEGAEHEIFSSEAGTFIRNCRYLIIEIHSTSGPPRAVAERLGALGFDLLIPKGDIPAETAVSCFKRTAS